MAFAATITNRLQLPPALKRSPDSGNLWFMWGTYTNGAGDSGGAITTGALRIIAAGATDSVGANAVQIQINTASDGQITLTTTAGDDGEWWAIVKY